MLSSSETAALCPPDEVQDCESHTTTPMPTSGYRIRIVQERGLLSAVLRAPLRAPKLLMLELVERVAAAVLVRATPGAFLCAAAAAAAAALVQARWVRSCHRSHVRLVFM